MDRPRASTLLLALIVLSGCGGGDATSPPGNQKSVGVTLASTSVSVVAGASATLAVSVVRGGGFSGSVSLSVEWMPDGVTVSFSPHPVAGSGSSSTMTIVVASSAAPGRYMMTVQALGSGVEEGGKAQFYIDIQPPPDYSLHMARDTIPVIQGATAPMDVNVTRVSGFTGDVTLALEGAPTGVTGTFVPNPVTGDRSTLSLVVGPSVPGGKYTLTVRGTAAGLPARTTTLVLDVISAVTSGFTISIAPTALSVVAGGSASIAVSIRRTGGFTGAVSLSVQGQPTGVTCGLPVGPVADTAATITFTAALALTGGTYAVNVVGKAAGYPDREAALQLTVQETAGYWITLSSNSITSANGAAPQTLTVQIARTGGFSDTVRLSMTDLPAGMTATFNPAATTANATLTIAVLSAAAGTYNPTLHATATGQIERTTRLMITVVTSATDAIWRFCDPTPSPVFFAFQDGVSPYVVVAPASDGSYVTGVASGRGAVVFVVPGLPDTSTAMSSPVRVTTLRGARIGSTAVAGYTTYMYYGSATDLQQVAQAQCTGGTRRTIHGSVAGVSATQAWSVGLGGASVTGLPGGGTTFTLNDVMSGPRDLVAARAIPATPGTLANALILRRAVNPAGGSTLPVLDFSGTEAFVPAEATLNVTGIPTGAMAEVLLGFSTANGTRSPIGQLDSVTTGTRLLIGMPEARLVAGDLHSIQASVETGNPPVELSATLYATHVGAWTVAFPSAPQPASVDVYATSPVIRMRARGSLGALGGAYGGLVHVSFVQAAAQRATVVYMSRNYLGSTGSYEIRTGGYNTLTGWNEAIYGFQPGAAARFTVELLTGGYVVNPANGTMLHAMRSWGQVTP